MTDIPQVLFEAVHKAESIVVLTGAGISAESGVPTFRDAMSGMWAKYDPMELATPEAFANDPEKVSRWYDWRRTQLADAQPNAGHLALVELEKQCEERGAKFTLVTQNVDRLHHAAESKNIVELHGTIWVWRCLDCSKETEELNVPFEEYPPRCSCGGVKRPAVVWFGEALPDRASAKAFAASSRCELFFSVGTSSVVEPAASFIHLAREGKAMSVEVNLEETPISQIVDWSIRGKAAEILPALVT